MLYLTLFAAGALTILLPCILPLIPIVLGVSIAGRNPWRPLLTVLGMVVSFVGFTFLLFVVLNQFVEFADYLRIATYFALYLFGIGFLIHHRIVQLPLAALGGLFFLSKGWIAVPIAALVGVILMFVGARIATSIQQFGSDVQERTRGEFGEAHPITAFLIGLTMGLVWVPCAGPALGFAFALVRDEPGLRAFLALTAYGLGTAVPLVLIGYGGQAALRSVRVLNRYTLRIKQFAGIVLILTSLAFGFQLFREIEIFFVNNTPFGNLGIDLELKLFGEDIAAVKDTSSPSVMNMELPKLSKITRAPEFVGLGPWHNSEPFTLESLRGKVVLVDFWTYSCINCIRTLPYIQGYWDKFKGQPFVLIGVHTPEFVFEKSEKNVADAIKNHGLTYPVAQDNDFGTWGAFANRYWPAKYLIDADGYIRYTHFGEGAYEETDLAIQSLLAEIGAEVTGQVTEAEDRGSRRNRSPEIYLGSRSWPSLVNGASQPTGQIVSYQALSELSLHSYALEGDWQMVEEERQVLRSAEGEIRMRFIGSEINLVMGLDEGAAPATVDIELDGEQTKSFTIGMHDLYELWTGEYGEHEIVIRISGAGAEGYAFTFGA
jgi:cytochrome c biogenesis protein CcdA/thiol-disulfide isomerase/thioredoxin